MIQSIRLHKLTEEHIEAIRKERAIMGRKKYGNAHLKRNLFRDMTEEATDIMNQAYLQKDKLDRRGKFGCYDAELHSMILDKSYEIIELIKEWEEQQDEKELVDNTDRVWFK